MQDRRTATPSTAPHPEDFVYQDTHQAGLTRDEIAQEMTDEIVAFVQKRFGFLEDAKGGPLLRIIFTNVESGEYKETILVAAPAATPNARHLTVVGGAA
ncbi:hypothetical protein [Streptomyces sp. NPDC055105]|uniref:hypothetical protein n=1 Tax=Streptomyces sp. NPDC055105 TaxID=3365719 RepID=UPI0037D46BFA